MLVVLAGVAFDLVLVDLVVAGWRRGRCYIGSAISANRALVSGRDSRLSPLFVPDGTKRMGLKRFVIRRVGETPS